LSFWQRSVHQKNSQKEKENININKYYNFLTVYFFSGINLAFKRGAEFPNLAKTDGIFISKILHKAFIEVFGIWRK